MQYDTESEYLAAISAVESAINRVMLIGQESSNNSGGSSRDNTEADIEALQARKAMLKRELRMLKGTGGVMTVRSGW